MGVAAIATMITAITALLAAIASVWKVIYDSRRQAKEESSSAVAEHILRQDKAIEKLEHRVDASTVRERRMGDYIYELRDHIANGRPPPPPSWPQELLRSSDK